MHSRFAALAVAAAGLAALATTAMPALAAASVPNHAGQPGGTRVAAGSPAASPRVSAGRETREAALARRAGADLASLRERALESAHNSSGSITGTVAELRGRPLADGCVEATGQGRSITADVTSAGRFYLTGLRAGGYTVAYRDCSAPAGNPASGSSPAPWQRAAVPVTVRPGQVSRLAHLTPPAAPVQLAARAASFARTLARDDRPVSAAEAAKTGAITGRVAGGGRPLRGICVEADPTGSGYYYVARTNSNGRYVLRGMIPRRYTVAFEEIGNCRDAGNWLQQYYRGHNTPFYTATILKITRGKTIRRIDARLIRGGQISGVVTSRTGKPLRGICADISGRFADGGAGYEVGTGRHGGYVLHALFPGKYSFEFQTGCSSQANYAAAFPRPVRIRHTDHRIVDAAMPVGAVITGTARLGSKTGKLLRGICVDATGGRGGIIELETLTRANGSYSFNSLGNGRYEVDFASPDCQYTGNYLEATVFARATEGKVTRGVNGVLQHGARISGTVTGPGGVKLGGICIQLSGPPGSNPNVPDNTARDGSYAITGMSAGSYELGFSTGCGSNGNYAAWYYNNQDDPSLASPLPVAAGSRHTIDARMQLGGEISGTVRGSHGRTLAGICVGADLPSTLGSGPGAFDDIVITGAGGRFTFTGLEPGPYYIDFNCGGGPRYADQWYPDAADAGAARIVSVTAGRTSGISATLRAAGSISGTVTSRSGKPLPNICVFVYSARTGASVGNPASGDVLLPFPHTNRHGIYRYTGLPAGSYKVQVDPTCGGSAVLRDAAQWYGGQATEAAGTAVRVRTGRITSGINARLAAGGVIAGRVTGPSGTRLGYVCISAFSSAGQSAFGFLSHAGSYRMTGVSSGSYTVEFAPCAGRNLVTVLRQVKVVAPKVTGNVNAAVTAGGSVSGVITTAGPGALPVASECVVVVSNDPGNPGALGSSGAGGKYRVAGLAAGTYTVFFGDPLCSEGPPGLVPQWYDNQSVQARATTISVTVGNATAGIDAALQPAAEITGTVTKTSGVALSGACVTAYPAASGSSAVTAVSRGNGGYSLADLQPGRYRVEFASGCGAAGYSTRWWQQASSRRAATVISVTAAQLITAVDAALPKP